MAVICSYTDFASGPLKINMSSFQQTDFASFVAIYEARILRELLTDKLQNEIAAAATLTGKYAALINGYYYTNEAGNKKTNAGLKELLKRFLYYYYRKDNWQSASTGATKNQSENSAALPNVENSQVIYSRYNEGVDIWNSDIVDFLTEYYAQEKTIDSYVDLGATCRILSADTLFLITGDNVFIDGVEYTVSNVVDNVSFEITGTGLTPSGTYSYYPFEDVNAENINSAWL